MQEGSESRFRKSLLAITMLNKLVTLTADDHEKFLCANFLGSHCCYNINQVLLMNKKTL